MMARSTAMICIMFWQAATAGGRLRVKLGEIVNNPNVAASTGAGCSSNGCSKGILPLQEAPLFSCVQPVQGEAVGDGLLGTSTNECSLTYRLHEESHSPSRAGIVALDSVFVAFAADSKRTLRVYLDGVVAVESWTGEEGNVALQQIPGLEGIVAEVLTIEAVMGEGDWIAITETEIYVDVDDVPVVGVSASDLVHVTTKATVKNEDARRTLVRGYIIGQSHCCVLKRGGDILFLEGKRWSLDIGELSWLVLEQAPFCSKQDGNTSKMRAWACTLGDVCEIVYDLRGLHFIEQVRIAFVGKSSTLGSSVNVYTAGMDGNYSSVLSDVPALVRGPSVRGDLQTYGGIRTWGRYLKIEGVVGSGGSLFITEVDIRIGQGCDTLKPPSRRYPAFSLPLYQDISAS